MTNQTTGPKDDEFVLLKENQWIAIEDEICRVQAYHKTEIKGTEMPYARVELECPKYNKIISGFITHKVDFSNLDYFFNSRKIKDNEELLITWSRKRYSTLGKLLYKYFSIFFPKIHIMVCRKGSYEKMTSKEWKEKHKGEAAFLEVAPIETLQPMSDNRFLL